MPSVLCRNETGSRRNGVQYAMLGRNAYERNKRWKALRRSDLTLDVDSAECGRPEWLKELELIRLRRQEQDVTISLLSLLKDRLASVVNDELGRMLVSFEAELFSDEA